ACFHGMFPGIEGAVAVVDLPVCVLAVFVGAEIEGSAESAGAVGGCAHAALQLDAVDGGGEVRHVHEESALRFRVVHGNTVDGHIDACDIGTAYAKASITYARAGIRVGDHGRQLVQQQREVLPEILLRDGFLVQVRPGEG